MIIEAIYSELKNKKINAQMVDDYVVINPKIKSDAIGYIGFRPRLTVFETDDGLVIRQEDTSGGEILDLNYGDPIDKIKKVVKRWERIGR